MARKIIVIWLVLLYAGVVSAQVEVISPDNGLSNRDVTCIFQTRNGFMWFGTLNGLNRYDGYEIISYHFKNNDHITSLHERKDGKLYVGTLDGLYLFDQYSGNYESQKLPLRTTGARSPGVSTITMLGDSTLFIGTDDGTVIHESNNNYRTVMIRLPEKISVVNNIRVRQDGSIWLLCDHYFIYKYSPAGVRDEHFNAAWIKEAASITFPACMESIGWAADRSLLLFDTKTGERRQNKLIDSLNKLHGGAKAFFCENNSECWLGFNNGEILKVNFVSGHIERYTHFVKPYITGAPRIFYKDKTGVMWLGTNFGVIKFFPSGVLFENILFERPDARLGEKYSIRGMVEDNKGNIYIGGYRGLLYYEPNTKKRRQFKMIDYRGNANNDYSPFRLVYDSTGYVWITSEGYGFYRFNIKTEKFEFPIHLTPDNSKHAQPTFALLRYSPDTFFIGSTRGLYVYSIKQNTINKFQAPKGKSDIGEQKIMDIEHADGDKLWIATANSGVYFFSLSQGIISYYSTQTSPAISYNNVTDILLTDTNTLWITTRGGGLNKLNIQTGSVTLYNKQNGLADNIIAGVVNDKSILWVATFNGLSALDKRTGHIINFFEKDGLADNEFNITAHLKTRDGKIWLGGLNGISAFFTEQVLNKHTQVPFIYLTKIIHHHGSDNSIEETNETILNTGIRTLSYNDNFISFFFSLADYYNQSQNKFFYKLEGIDNDWVNIGSQRFVRFNKLPSGKYTLKIKGVNYEGTESGNIITIELIVTKAFYYQAWFIALMVLLIGLLVYGMVRYRKYQREKLQHLRTKISSDLHDEVGSILTRISVQAELIKQGVNDASEKEEALSKISEASRQATSTMSDVLWSIDARNDKMQHLIDHMREHVLDMLTPLDIEVQFEITGLDQQKEVDTVIRQQLFLIFKEAINNIAKHSNAKHVLIKMYNENDEFTLLIHDDGTKSEANIFHQGQGLRNMRARAKSIDAEIVIDDEKGFEITVKRKSFC